MEGGEGNPPGKELESKGFRNEVIGCPGSTRSEAKRLGGFKYCFKHLKEIVCASRPPPRRLEARRLAGIEAWRLEGLESLRVRN